ncbi:MAG: RdgB/HAM1 family non-canonical purine NTP pyrophosphatase [Mycobacteriales bacterium]
MKLLLATHNRKKLVELERIVAEAGGSEIELLDIDDLADGSYPEPIEDGATFAANALLKARAGAAASGLPTVADDSGLAVEALNGMPGVLSARWAGRAKNDEDNLRLVLDQVHDVPDGRRGAAFVCVAAYVTPAGEELLAEGRLEGTLARGPRGANGFGYDPIFVPLGDTRTTAEMEPAAKDAISHRGQAFRALVRQILEGRTARV